MRNRTVMSQLNLTTDSSEVSRSTGEEMYPQQGYAYVQVGGSCAQLNGAVSPRGTRYVKTQVTSVEYDNLLNLPESG